MRGLRYFKMESRYLIDIKLSIKFNKFAINLHDILVDKNTVVDKKKIIGNRKQKN